MLCCGVCCKMSKRDYKVATTDGIELEPLGGPKMDGDGKKNGVKYGTYNMWCEVSKFYYFIPKGPPSGPLFLIVRDATRFPAQCCTYGGSILIKNKFFVRIFVLTSSGSYYHFSKKRKINSSRNKTFSPRNDIIIILWTTLHQKKAFMWCAKLNRKKNHKTKRLCVIREKKGKNKSFKNFYGEKHAYLNVNISTSVWYIIFSLQFTKAKVKEKKGVQLSS